MQNILVGDDGRSPVVAIKQKELELAAELSATKEVAERTVAEAHQAAAAYLRQVERDARAFAATEYRRALDEVEAEAAEIRAAGERAALVIAARGAAHMNAAVDRILHIVVPQASHNGPMIPPATAVGQEAQVSHA
jgi:vacuolar-type H+-ATPase subunit H